MAKKFDVVIGNPPYQEEATGSATHNMPIYNRFMDAAYEVGEKVVLITPARFLFNAGYTPKAWNEKMLSDPHLTVPIYVRDSSELFPGTKIRAGIAVTYRDAARKGEPVGTFTEYPELNRIVHKVAEHGFKPLEALNMTSSRSYRYTAAMHEAFPQALGLMPSGEQFKINTKTFENLSFLYSEERPQDGHEYVQLLGVIKNKRVLRWIRSAFVTGPEGFNKFKVAVPAANESKKLGQMAAPQVLGPKIGVTQTFLTIGAFDTESEAQACFAYVKTKFARAMLYVLKVTQHNPRSTWKFVPAEDFTKASDIDWTKTGAEIDAQLYAKYGLDTDEISFLENQIVPMS
ncbi:Eco57I restriction-modification methylase domain-containing protein [Leifsonia virtsii]|uniref:Eco57I restriction-modification methylase domain-containing protein n=1 Tax=Leifsonia virtsii TaxID=3035915 RepID=A0ABT8IYY6_9MICO|nr:Eco57I restriction-modification methylase domain-containing protein [Leifsonia virtsii]MDN4597587.1 Eco57I restriction-modification methylase domain-containing protein [Leifsonia virtsii]